MVGAWDREFKAWQDDGKGGLVRRDGPMKVLRWDRQADRLLSGDLTADADKVRRPRVLCGCDWLDPIVPIEWLADLLTLIAETPQLDWMLPTKWPGLWRDRMVALIEFAAAGLTDEETDLEEWAAAVQGWVLAGQSPPNVWIGARIEDQKQADDRLPDLLNIPARVRFLLCDPLVEHVWLPLFDDMEGDPSVPGGTRPIPSGRIHWVIVAGESGANARPFDLAWARSVRDQCAAAGVPCFVRQLGANPFGPKEWAQGGWTSGQTDNDGAYARRLHDRAGADPAEWPADLQVQQVLEIDR